MKHLVDKTILVPFREELKYAVCIVSGRRSPAFRQGKHRVRLYASRSSGQKPGPTLGRPVGPKGREKRKPPLFGRVSRCVPSFGRGQQPCTPDGLGLVSGICGGRKKKQEKGQASKLPLCPVTSARSAGSYGDFYVAVKWGQKQQTGITFAVTFPECLEAWTKTRGHAGDTYSFLLLCHTVSAGAPPQKLRY